MNLNFQISYSNDLYKCDEFFLAMFVRQSGAYTAKQTSLSQNPKRNCKCYLVRWNTLLEQAVFALANVSMIMPVTMTRYSDTLELALATLVSSTEIEMILSVLRHPRRPRQVRKAISYRDVASVMLQTLCQCKRTCNTSPSKSRKSTYQENQPKHKI